MILFIAFYALAFVMMASEGGTRLAEALSMSSP